ncbi:MAG: YdjY domain-containing protein [Planctomycetota bacterium]
MLIWTAVIGKWLLVIGILVVAFGCATEPKVKTESRLEPAPSRDLDAFAAAVAEDARVEIEPQMEATSPEAEAAGESLDEIDELDALSAAIAEQARVEPEPTAAPIAPTPMPEVFPGVRADASLGVVEFDGTVAIDAHNPNSPVVYLEVVVCAPDSKEHEALVVADIRASHLHAALLLAGVTPGTPTSWLRTPTGLRAEPATGDAVRVEFIVDGGEPISPTAWIRHETDAVATPSDWLFAGSRLRDRDGDGRDEYDADGTGLLIGLHAFGSEVVAWAEPAHPDSGVEEPVWLAFNEALPDRGTPVRVRLSRKE